MDYDRMLLSALNEAAGRGIGFLEARWGSYRRQILGARDQIVSVMVDETSQGMNVRVFHRGAWGFSAAVVNEEKDVIRLVKTAKSVAEASAKIAGGPLQLSRLQAHQAEWKSPAVIDPFTVSLKEKLELLLELNSVTAGCDGITEANSHMRFHRMEKKYVNTLGSRIDQTIVWSDAGYSVSAVGNNRCETREYPSLSQAIGYEGIDTNDMLKAAPRIAREAVEQLTAKPWDQDKADLILLPSHTRLVIHETIGHATELDRILGWEADYAGTSFATPEKLNSFRYGSNLFNVTADRTQKHGLATCAYDDEGVPSGEWPIVKNGILCGYSTTRDTAPLIGDDESHGCSFADHWQSFPILRMANIGIDPGTKDAPMLADLIADTQDGILVDGMGAFSIDHQRINFQFGSDYCRRIRNGHLDEPLWNVVYDGSNPSFWSSVDAVCHPDEWRPYGVFGCAKGQPVQIAALTHGSAPMRLRNISIRRNS